MDRVTRIVIIGGGPGGYEAALVAAQLGAEVTVVDRDGLGGASVLTDCVPSKTLIATAEVMTSFDSRYEELGIIVADDTPPDKEAARVHGVDLARVNSRVKRLAQAQSRDITSAVTRTGVRVVRGRGRLETTPALAGAREVTVTAADGSTETLPADAVLIATGAHPREIPDAQPDGERILNWTQVYDLEELPEELIVVGSGVTGAEFAGAYQALGSKVTLVSSRDRVLPGEDPDAAAVLEDVFRRRGMNVMARSRAAAAKRVGRPGGGDARRRPGDHRHPLPDGGRLDTEHGGDGPGGGRGPAEGVRPRLDRQGLAHHRAGRVRGRGLHRRASPWRRWPRCRAGSRCTTSWATRSRR